MAEITLRITDTSTGGVAVHTTSTPPYQHPLTPAQRAALEIQQRTAREWGIAATTTTNHGAL